MVMMVGIASLTISGLTGDWVILRYCRSSGDRLAASMLFAKILTLLSDIELDNNWVRQVEL